MGGNLQSNGILRDVVLGSWLHDEDKVCKEREVGVCIEGERRERISLSFCCDC